MLNYENVQKACTSYFNKSNELSKKLQQYEWVPCNKRLPDEPEYYDEKEGYIIQKDDWAPFEAYWDGEYWTDSEGDRVKDVIAWMPLPDSYKG